MAEKEIGSVIKLQIPAGKASPAPPVGPALGGTGVNIMQFVKEFNDRTANLGGVKIPVVLTVYKDKTFEEIKHIDELGNEYWEARELMSALEYSKWEHFTKAKQK